MLYSKLAYKKALRSVSLNNVISFLVQQISCLEKLDPTEQIQKKIIDARTTLALYFYQLTEMKSALTAIKPIIDITKKLGYQKGLSKLHTVMGIINYWLEEDLFSAIENLTKAIKVSEEIGDYISLILSNLQMAMVLTVNSEFEKATIHYQEAINLTVANYSSWGEISITGVKAVLLSYFAGHIEREQKNVEKVIKLAQQSGDIYSKFYGYGIYGKFLYCKGLLKDSESFLIKTLELCNETYLSMLEIDAHYTLAETYYRLKEFQKSSEH